MRPELGHLKNIFSIVKVTKLCIVGSNPDPKCQNQHTRLKNETKTIKRFSVCSFLKMGRSQSLFVNFRSFLYTISIIQIEKVQMVCLGFEPGPQDGRRSRNHGAMASAPLFARCLILSLNFSYLFLFLPLSYENLDEAFILIISRGFVQVKLFTWQQSLAVIELLSVA